jgi:hypothetical protein
MSRLQRFFKWIMPRKWFEAAKADSKLWMVKCPCGAGRSIWDIGGLRWKGGGKPKTWMRCEACDERRWMTVEKSGADS